MVKPKNPVPWYFQQQKTPDEIHAELKAIVRDDDPEYGTIEKMLGEREPARVSQDLAVLREMLRFKAGAFTPREFIDEAWHKAGVRLREREILKFVHEAKAAGWIRKIHGNNDEDDIEHDVYLAR